MIARANECNVTTDGKTIVSTVFYTYDKDGKLVKKRVMSADGNVRTYNFENPEDGNALLRFEANGKTVTSQSKTDSFGRKVFEELQLGSGFVSRQFSYLSGDITEEHRTGEKLKSSPTTQLVSQITYSGGRTVSYEYDAEERITKVTDSVDGVTEYAYDALGQLLTEKKNGTVVNTMTYDNYGNIKSKNGVAYTYGNSSWKDLLTAYNGVSIEYDAQGNPTSYLGHTLVWEKGRQLKAFDTNTYTYNANGIRTSKTVNGITHNYILAGTKILRETWGENVLIPLYDNEDSVCGIEYNGNAFYFVRNLQNDIVAITDKDGETVAKYTYDAWGACTVAEDTSEIGIATVNPYRYRGYYYDTEIGMYYLQSRYYDPVVGRFINADDVAIISMSKENYYNISLFSYCNNNPIIYSDCSGMLPLWAKIAIGIVGIAAAIALTVASGGALFPAILTTLKFVAGSMAISMAINGLVGYLQNGMSGLKKGLLDGAADGFMWGGITAAISAAMAFIKVMRTVKTIRNFTVCKKHLTFGGGNWSKFNTANQNVIRDWIRTAILKGKPIPNGEKKDSFIIVYKIGKIIGKNGEKAIRVVYDNLGNIWTAFPTR